MRTAIMLIFGVLIIALLSDLALAGRVARRQVRQQARIAKGVQSGEVTRGEYAAIQGQQIHIQRSKRRAWSDGELTADEKVRLERKQNRASRNIYRIKHNDRQQP